MAGVETCVATLASGTMCSPEVLGAALRELAQHSANSFNQLVGHIGENTSAHDELRAATQDTRNMLIETRQMVTAIEGPFTELRNMVGHLGGTAGAVSSTLLQRIVSLESTANSVTGELVGQVTQLQNTVCYKRFCQTHKCVLPCRALHVLQNV